MNFWSVSVKRFYTDWDDRSGFRLACHSGLFGGQSQMKGSRTGEFYGSQQWIVVCFLATGIGDDAIHLNSYEYY